MTLHEAQVAYDAQEPEAEADNGGCFHDWRLTGTAPDGTDFYKCRKCGEESE